MTYDPIANTYSDGAPPCPFCGAPPIRPAILPPSYIECSSCWFRVPGGRWADSARALAGDTGAAARQTRDAALVLLRDAQSRLATWERHLAQDIERLEAGR